MFEDENRDWLRRFTQEDMVASGLRVTLGCLGPAGSIIAEFITNFVPRQRIDRLHDFVECLSERMATLEDQFQARIDSSAPYAALVEDACLAAVRTPSAQRRKDLATILRTGLSREDDEIIAHQALLRVLESLNEVQLLMLMAEGGLSRGLTVPEVNAIYDKFNGPEMYAGDDIVRRHAFRDYYNHDLIAKGLLEETETTALGRPTKRVGISALGQLLLDAIDRPNPAASV